MRKDNEEKDLPLEKLHFNVAIVGGGKICKFFLELQQRDLFPYLDITISGVCDINPEAEGFCLAKKMGIYTTTDFRDLFNIKGLNGILEFTNNRDVLLDLIRLRPKKVGVLEHNIGRLLRSLFIVNQGIQLADKQIELEKDVSNFLMRQSNERIVIIKPDFTIVDANESFLEAVGKPKEMVIGAPCYKVTHRLNAPCSIGQPELGCPLVETLKSGDSACVIHEHPVPDGQPKYCDMVTYPLKNPSGEIVRVIEIWRDITDKISTKMERRVSEMKADLQKMIQEDRMISLGKLVASSVHEINNPIQGLLTFSHLMLDILEEGTLNGEHLENFKKYLSLMASELERCGKIVSDLLSFSRQSRTDYQEVDLNEILKEVIALTRHKMEIQNIQLKSKLSSNPLGIIGDVHQLQQCFLNLIFNAIEAMPEGGQLMISSKWNRARGNAVIEIRDTGCGIPENILGHIFDPFYTTKKEGEGIGMGLSIVYGIVKNHKGNIEVDSRVGKGTSVIVTFHLS